MAGMEHHVSFHFYCPEKMMQKNRKICKDFALHPTNGCEQ
jgi:hypothetical protein